MFNRFVKWLKSERGALDIDGAILGIVAFVIIASVITSAITGTDAGSVLIQSVGFIIAGAGVLFILVRAFLKT